MSASLLPNAELQFVDGNGKPLAGGKVYYYIPNTSTLKSTYQDAAQTILNTNPVVLDAAGRAIVWGSGTYRQVVYDQYGNLVWDQITEDANSGLVGNMTDETFVSGTDFTPGMTTQLTLSTNPGAQPNTWVYFDAAFQGDDQYTISGTTLTFNTAIPVGVQNVYVKIGSTIAVGTPSNGSVTDLSVATGTALYNRLIQPVSVMDPAYGAKGDGTTDDTVAIQNCINANPYVFFPAGKTFKTTATIVVPTTCYRIDGTAAFMTGPGKTGTVDGFSFSGFYQGGGSIPVKSEQYILPSLNGYRYGVKVYNSGFLRIYTDTIENVVAGYFISCDNSSNYCFELELEARYLWHCRDSANTTGGAFYWQSTGTAVAPFQGNRSKAFYVDDVFAGVYHEYSSTGDNGIFCNEYDLGELDQSDYAVYCTPAPHSSQQLYKIPMGITGANNAQMFYQVSTSDIFQVGGLSFNDPSWTAFTNSQYNGTTNRPGIPIFTGTGGQPPTAHVSNAGSDTTGNGSVSKPFATIQKALTIFQGLDLFGQTAFIYVADGTYTAGANSASFGSSGCNGVIAVVGDPANPAGVVINNIGTTSFSVNGYGAALTLSGMTINGGILAQSGGVIQIAPGVVFGNDAGGNHIQAIGFGSQVQILSNYTVTGAATNHYLATLGGVISNQGASAITFSGTVPMSIIANASQAGQISVAGIAYSGSGVSGQRYNAQLGGGIYTGGGGANYFPGNSAGTATSPGWYA